MSISEEQRYKLKIKALYYYYKEDMKFLDIAKLLNISRVTLKKLVEEAKEEGLLRIEIVDTKGTLELVELEASVRDRFHLKDVKIINCESKDFQTLVRDIAFAGARYVEQKMQDGIKIAVSWGLCLDLLTRALHPNPRIRNIEVYTLMGGAGVADSQIQPNIIAQNLLQNYDGIGYVMNAPFYCKTKELCETIKSDEHIQWIINNSANADITLVGIGAKPDITLNKEFLHYNEDVIREMQALHACGDICSNFYDINGVVCNSSFHDHIVAIDISNLHKHKCVIGIGGGGHKVSSILGALNGRYLDVLITDTYTMKQVLELSDILTRAT